MEKIQRTYEEIREVFVSECLATLHESYGVCFFKCDNPAAHQSAAAHWDEQATIDEIECAMDTVGRMAYEFTLRDVTHVIENNALTAEALEVLAENINI